MRHVRDRLDRHARRLGRGADVRVRPPDEADDEARHGALAPEPAERGPERPRVARPVEAADVGEDEGVVADGRGGHALQIRLVHAVLDDVDGPGRQIARPVEPAGPRRADGDDGVGRAEHAALEGPVERPGRPRHREVVVEVDGRPRVPKVRHPGDAEPEPDEVGRVRRARREDGGVRPVLAGGLAEQVPGRAPGERDPPDPGVREEHVRPEPDRQPGERAAALPDRPHGDGLLAAPPGEAGVERERVGRRRPHDADALGHVAGEALVEARVRPGLDRQHDRLVPERAEVPDGLERPLDARPARRREVVRDDEDPHGRVFGRLATASASGAGGYHSGTRSAVVARRAK